MYLMVFLIYFIQWVGRPVWRLGQIVRLRGRLTEGQGKLIYVANNVNICSLIPSCVIYRGVFVDFNIRFQQCFRLIMGYINYLPKLVYICGNDLEK